MKDSKIYSVWAYVNGLRSSEGFFLVKVLADDASQAIDFGLPWLEIVAEKVGVLVSSFTSIHAESYSKARFIEQA